MTTQPRVRAASSAEQITAVPERPFRALCPEADMRDAMSEDDFWAHVFRQPEPFDDGPELDDTTNQDKPCPLCGEQGACGYDNEGRPLIHALDAQEDE